MTLPAESYCCGTPVMVTEFDPEFITVVLVVLFTVIVVVVEPCTIVYCCTCVPDAVSVTFASPCT